MSSIEIDISQTLNKLHTLLNYSTSDKADVLLEYITKAKEFWESNEDLTEENV